MMKPRSAGVFVLLSVLVTAALAFAQPAGAGDARPGVAVEGGGSPRAGQADGAGSGDAERAPTGSAVGAPPGATAGAPGGEANDGEATRGEGPRDAAAANGATPEGAGGGGSADETPGGLVIPAGREQLIVDLLEPYAGDDAAHEGWAIPSISIERNTIVYTVQTDAGQTAEVRLRHRSLAQASERRTESFAVSVDGTDADALAAAELVVAAVSANDRGGIFEVTTPNAGGGRGTRAATHRVSMRGATLAFLGAGLLAVFGYVRNRERWRFLVVAGLLFLAAAAAWWLPNAADLAGDGLFWGLVAGTMLFFVTWKQLELVGRKAGLALAGIVVAGVGVRLAMAPDTTLGAWPYSRRSEVVRELWFGYLYPKVSAELGATPYFTDFAGDVGLVFAFLAPIAVFCHATQLLGNARAGLFAATAIAFLPMHIRFSHSEVAFIPSIVLSSLTFAMLHTALKDEDPVWRAVGICSVLPLSALVFVTRPLNLLYSPLMFFTAIFLVPPRVPVPRRAFAAVLLIAAGLAGYFLHLKPSYASNVGEGMSFDVVIRGIGVLFSPHSNTLIRPDFTPPLLTWLALAGAFLAVKDKQRRMLGIFLIGWLLFFLITHAYVVPRRPEMQARYHLHLVVPFLLLAAEGASRMFDKWPKTIKPAWVIVILSPLIHFGFITDIAFNDQLEFNFVRETRSIIDEGCTVVEYSGHKAHSARYGRMGEFMRDGERLAQFTVVDIGAQNEGHGTELSDAARDVLRDPPACTYFYEGLPCWYAVEGEDRYAPQCRSVRRALNWEEVASVEFANRGYNGPWFVWNTPDDAPITLKLYRYAGAGAR